MEVPNGPADTATFGLSNTTDVSISANTEVNGITFSSAATNPYTITASPGFTLTISGVGITNNSGITQNFVTAVEVLGSSATGINIVHQQRDGRRNSTFFTNNGAHRRRPTGGMNSSTPQLRLMAPLSTIVARSRHIGGRNGFFNSSTAAKGNFTNNGSPSGRAA